MSITKIKLTVRDGLAPSVPDLNDPGIQVWRDPHERIWAYVFESESDNWLHFPEIGRFHFTEESQEVHVLPQPNIQLSVIEDIFYRAVVPLVLQAQGTEVLHASALEIQDGVVAFCAPSGTGKSTTAFALTRMGYRVVADDALPFVVHNSDVRVLPLPFRLRLWQETAHFFSKQEGVNSHHTASKEVHTDSMKLSIIVLLRKQTGVAEGVRISRLASTDAFTEVLANSWWFSLASTERKRRIIANYMQLVACVPVFEVHFQPGLELLPEVLEAIQEIISRCASESH